MAILPLQGAEPPGSRAAATACAMPPATPSQRGRAIGRRPDMAVKRLSKEGPITGAQVVRPGSTCLMSEHPNSTQQHTMPEHIRNNFGLSIYLYRNIVSQ